MHEHYEDWLEADRRRKEREREIHSVNWGLVALVVAIPFLPFGIWILAEAL